jgi:major type 1 subunit fimbrin (pilin)
MKTPRLSPMLGAFGLMMVAGGIQAADGEINFKGSVETSTCAISVGDTSGGVSGEAFIGAVPARALAKAGDIAGGGHFSLIIDSSDPGCDLASKAASVTFVGLTGADGPSAQWLGIEKVAGAAGNVAIQIRDGKGDEVRLNEASADYLDPTQPLAFTANYIATGAATAGPANAKASFTVDIH